MEPGAFTGRHLCNAPQSRLAAPDWAGMVYGGSKAAEVPEHEGPTAPSGDQAEPALGLQRSQAIILKQEEKASRTRGEYKAEF